MRQIIHRTIVSRATSYGSRSSSPPVAYRALSSIGAATPPSASSNNNRLIQQRPNYATNKSLLIERLQTPIISSSNFSSAAAMPQVEVTTISSTNTSSSNSEPKKKQQRTRRTLDPLLITPTAAARIQFLINQHNSNAGGGPDGKPAVGIRLGTKKRGCNGLSYTLNYAYDNHASTHKRDEGMQITLQNDGMAGHGLMVYVEPMALMNVIGTTMDFVDDEMSSEFTFTNPNSKGECGCGESFNV